MESDTHSEPDIESNSRGGNQQQYASEITNGKSTDEINDGVGVVEAGESSNGTNDDGLAYSSMVLPMETLPPLPEPKYDLMRQESSRGVCLVVTASILLPFLTHYVALTAIPPSSNENSNSTGSIVFLALIYSEAVLALVCMMGILFVDPCVVNRSPENCFPLPPEIESWLMEGGKEEDGGGRSTWQQHRRTHGLQLYIKGTENAKQGVYCTRCLLWRKPGTNCFHCPTCQRCCLSYDHHCNVFGRCIAGRLRFWEPNETHGGSGVGNKLFFVTLIAVAGWTYFTVVSAFIFACAMRFGVGYAVPIGLVVMFVISCCCFNNGPLRTVCWPVRRLMVLVKNIAR